MVRVRYYCREYGKDVYLLSDYKDMNDALIDFRTKIGENRFILFRMEEFEESGRFICYYPRPIFQGDFNVEGYNLIEIKDARAETKIESFEVNDIKHLKI